MSGDLISVGVGDLEIETHGEKNELMDIFDQKTGFLIFLDRRERKLLILTLKL